MLTQRRANVHCCLGNDMDMFPKQGGFLYPKNISCLLKWKLTCLDMCLKACFICANWYTNCRVRGHLHWPYRLNIGCSCCNHGVHKQRLVYWYPSDCSNQFPSFPCSTRPAIRSPHCLAPRLDTFQTVHWHPQSSTCIPPKHWVYPGCGNQSSSYPYYLLVK